jgi:hypothetical protein
MVFLQETYLASGHWLAAAFALLVPASYRQSADVAKAGNQTGLASGSSLTQARQEISLGVYGTTAPTPRRVTLWGSYGAFPAVIDRHAAMMLT